MPCCANYLSLFVFHGIQCYFHFSLASRIESYMQLRSFCPQIHCLSENFTFLNKVSQRCRMAQSAQDRFDKLFPNRSKPSSIKADNLTFAEKELLDYHKKQEQPVKLSSVAGAQDDKLLEAANFSTNTAQDSGLTGSRRVTKPISTSHAQNQRPPHQQGHLSGTGPDAVVFVPTGLWRGGLSATKTDLQDEHEPEPPSSSTQCTGQFCVFPLVLKFPYKFMSTLR